MTNSSVARARAYGYRAFYRLPFRWRRAAVRVVSAKYTVGAVVLVRDPRGEHLLLLRQPPGRGWSLPGGLLSRKEPPVHGAARELAEETGIRLDPQELVPAAPNAIVHPRGRWVDMVFEARVGRDTDLAVDGGEVFEAAWHRLDDLPRLTTPTGRLLAHYGVGPYAEHPEVVA
jgi:ADP-ribose pyrophosphatase YjhB (NUDIX family)